VFNAILSCRGILAICQCNKIRVSELVILCFSSNWLIVKTSWDKAAFTFSSRCEATASLIPRRKRSFKYPQAYSMSHRELVLNYTGLQDDKSFQTRPLYRGEGRGRNHIRHFVVGKSRQIWQVSKITKLKEARPMGG
jgi:hypothetical protein